MGTKTFLTRKYSSLEGSKIIFDVHKRYLILRELIACLLNGVATSWVWLM